MTQRDEGHDFRDSKNKAQAYERKQAEKEKLLKVTLPNIVEEKLINKL